MEVLAMSKGLMIALGAAALFVVFGLGVVGCAVGFNNTCVTQENGIKAQYSQNQNSYDNMWKKIKEVAQVPEMYTDDLKKVYTSAIQGRYGASGSKAVFQWIQEHNPNVDASIYKQVQQVIEAGRLSFEAEQKMLVDKKRVYENILQVFPNSMFAGMFGFPRIDLAKFDIMTSDETQRAFETKRAEPLRLRDPAVAPAVAAAPAPALKK
jgi:hypothetical protein